MALLTERARPPVAKGERSHHRATRVWPTLALTLSIVATSALAEKRDETSLKAAFLLNFARLVEWPDAAFPTASSRFRVCAVGSETMQQRIDAIFDEREIGTRPVDVVNLTAPQEISDCQLAYLEFGDDTSPDDWFDAATGHSVLTVGHTEGFATKGGVINFYLDQGRVRFEVNPQAARAASLRVSSRLLRLGRIVER